MQSDHLWYKKIGLFSKKVCYKVSLCENSQQISCKAFTGLSNRAQMVGGGRPLKRKFCAWSEPPTAAEVVPISAFRKLMQHSYSLFVIAELLVIIMAACQFYKIIKRLTGNVAIAMLIWWLCMSVCIRKNWVICLIWRLEDKASSITLWICQLDWIAQFKFGQCQTELYLWCILS